VNYLISGYYGEGNTGDEAILAGILQEVARRDPDARFGVLSFNPDDTEQRHGRAGLDLEVLPTSLRFANALRTAMRAADLLVSGGGSFLHEADFELFGRSFLFRAGKLRPVPYFLSIIFMARSLGLPVMWYAQGLGPLHTRSARRLVRAAGSISQVVTWRDLESARLAYSLGVTAPVQMVVPDPAYSLEPAPTETVSAVLASVGLEPGRRFVAVCPRPWLGRSGYLDGLARALELARAAESSGAAGAFFDADILLIPLHQSQDPGVCEHLAATLTGRPGLAAKVHSLPSVESPAVVAGILARAELTVAMRLHSGILSAISGTPVVTIDYDPKTNAFAAQTGQLSWSVSVEALENGESGSQALAAGILDTLGHSESRRAALVRRVGPLREEAGRTAQLAVQLANRRAGSTGRTPDNAAVFGARARGDG
jgi:polysaccharide pyruvyl transferase CsaB